MHERQEGASVDEARAEIADVERERAGDGARPPEQTPLVRRRAEALRVHRRLRELLLEHPRGEDRAGGVERGRGRFRHRPVRRRGRLHRRRRFLPGRRPPGRRRREGVAEKPPARRSERRFFLRLERPRLALERPRGNDRRGVEPHAKRVEDRERAPQVPVDDVLGRADVAETKPPGGAPPGPLLLLRRGRAALGGVHRRAHVPRPRRARLRGERRATRRARVASQVPERVHEAAQPDSVAQVRAQVVREKLVLVARSLAVE